MKTAPTMNHPDQPTGNAFNAAVAKILGQSDPGWNFTWTVSTDLGRLHIGITIDDSLGMTFLDAPAAEKLDEIGADRFTNRWNIAAESLPDPEMRLRELVKRLARVGWVPVVAFTDVRAVEEIFSKTTEETQDAVSLARKMAAAPLMLEALQNLENDDGATMPASAWKLVQDAIKAATI